MLDLWVGQHVGRWHNVIPTQVPKETNMALSLNKQPPQKSVVHMSIRILMMSIWLWVLASNHLKSVWSDVHQSVPHSNSHPNCSTTPQISCEMDQTANPFALRKGSHREFELHMVNLFADWITCPSHLPQREHTNAKTNRKIAGCLSFLEKHLVTSSSEIDSS